MRRNTVELTAAEAARLSRKNREAWGRSAGPAVEKPRPSLHLAHARVASRADPLPMMLAAQCRAAGLPQPLVEYPFAKSIGRKFRADCFFAEAKLVVEVQGAVHRIEARFKADRERSQVIAIMGYRLMLVAPADVRSGDALRLVREALTVNVAAGECA